MIIIWQKDEVLPRKNMYLKVFLVLEADQTSSRITISDPRSTLFQYNVNTSVAI